MENLIKYSVVVPAFNSLNTIGELCQRVTDFFQKEGSSFEIIIVNDGGDSKVWEEIKEVYAKFEGKISIIKLSKNFGQHNATICGMENSNGEFVVTIDDDLQLNPEDIGVLITSLENESSDLVYGIFDYKKHSAFRNAGSQYVKKSSKILLKSPGNGSSFRLMSKFLADKVIEHSSNFIYIDEILWWHTDNISFVKVGHNERSSKKSSYNTFDLFKMFSKITIHYTDIPLKIMSFIGFFLSGVSFLLGMFFIYRKLVHNVPLGYTSLMVTILFSSSIILLSIGLLGQYVFKLYQLQNKKPSYTIKRRLSK